MGASLRIVWSCRRRLSASHIPPCRRAAAHPDRRRHRRDSPEGVGGHRDRVAGVQPAMGAVPLDGAPDGGRPAVAHGEGRAAFLGVAHPPHFRSFCVQGRSAHSWANMPPRALTGASWRASPTSTVLVCAAVVAVNSRRKSSVPTMAASSTTTRSRCPNRRLPSARDFRALATVYPWVPAPSRTATSTALPVGATMITRAWKRRRAIPASARIEVVLPAPAGADSGHTSCSGWRWW